MEIIISISTNLSLEENNMFSIGVDIGGMSIKGGLVNEKGEVLSTFDLVVDRTINGEIIADQLCDLINSFISKNNLSKKIIADIQKEMDQMVAEDLKFIKMSVRRTEAIKVGTNVIGNVATIKIVKNKVAPPYKSCLVDIIYGKGISKVGCTLDMATEMGIIQKTGSWFAYNDEKIGQGRENAKQYLEQHPEVMDEIDKKVRETAGL